MSFKRKQVDTVFIYNLILDLDSQVLSASHDWVYSIAEQVNSVFVYTTKVGKYDLPAHVTVTEIGGGNWYKRIRAVLILISSLKEIIKYRRSCGVFHHMSSRTAAILGLPIRILGIRQAFWYSHSHASPSMRIATIFTNVLVTSTPGAAPSNSRKVLYVGHGINSRLFSLEGSLSRNGIVSIGRLVPVKNLENILNALADSKYRNTKLTFIGPAEQSNAGYAKYLLNRAEEKSVNLQIKSGVPRPMLKSFLNTQHLVYSGTPASVDKAVIEAAMCGCFPVSSNTAVLIQTGMAKIWQDLCGQSPDNIESQIDYLMNLDEIEIVDLRMKISRISAEMNDVSAVTRKILDSLRRD